MKIGCSARCWAGAAPSWESKQALNYVNSVVGGYEPCTALTVLLCIKRGRNYDKMFCIQSPVGTKCRDVLHAVVCALDLQDAADHTTAAVLQKVHI